MSQLRSMACCLCALTLVASSRAANVVLNPSFEIEGPGGPSDSLHWDTIIPPVDGAINSRSSLFASDGSWSHYMTTMGTNGNGGTGLLTYEHILTGLPSLAESQQIVASFDVKYFETSDFAGLLTMTIVGPNLGPIEDVSVNFPESSSGFESVQTPELAVPAFGNSFPDDDSYFVQLVFRIASSRSQTDYAEAFIDNVVVDAILVPEPASAVLGLTAFLIAVPFISLHRSLLSSACQAEAR